MALHAAALLAFATFVFVMTPGPGVFALVSRALSHGARAGLMLTLGLMSADVLYLSFALGGLAVVAAHFYGLFLVVKLAGAAYLLWLGIKALQSRPRPMRETAAAQPAGWRDFTAGFLTSASNPKVILFYLGLLPAFVDLQHMTWTRYSATVLIVAGTLFLGCLIYITLCTRMRRLFHSRRAVRRLNRATGIVLMAAGALVAGTPVGQG